ncbi:fatty acid desaturase [Saccharothrix lopnurensis]|uniref:Fatty acid desaturase n=1 Tax=Saccharothrix lopnurensis TaxID=1670621 RepID=A0ABW1NXQ9_9PSEU
MIGSAGGGAPLPPVHDVPMGEHRDGVSVRDSMPRPGVLALPLTLLTGKPTAGQRPFRFTPTAHLVNALLSVGCGLVAGWFALRWSGWALLLLVPCWSMVLHGIRNLRMMMFHQCAHRNMWNRRRADSALGRFIAALLVIQGFTAYSREHVVDHHAVNHMTLRDPTVQAFLLTLRLRPGMSRRDMWRRVLGLLVSPRFHTTFLIARVRSYAHGSSTRARIGAAALHGSVAATAVAADAAVFLLVCWLLPLTVFFQVSNTLRLCVKHTFPTAEQRDRRGRAYFASLTNAIFIGERAPDRALRGPRAAAAWTRWWARLLVVHFPARYLVLTGDTVCHDFHHRFPMSRQWADYIFAREADAAAGTPGWPPYRHVWGLVPAIDAVFDSLRVADPAEYDPDRLADVSSRELFAAFDD